MSPETIDLTIKILTILFGGGGLAVVTTAIHNRRKAPLDRTQVISQASSENVTAALAIAQEARSIAAEANARSNSLHTEVMQLRAALELFRSWANNIVRHWETIRLDPSPPVPPETGRH